VNLSPLRSRSLGRASALPLLALLAAPAVAGESLGHAADLRFGPLLGGEPVRLDLRTTSPAAPFALFLSAGGSPTKVGPKLLPLGVDLSGPFLLFFGSTDPTGRFAATLPTAPGQFGPAGLGNALFVQAIALDQLGRKVASNVEVTEVEPLPVPAGFLQEAAGLHLPAGYDQLGGNAIESGDIDHDGWVDILIATDLDVRIWHNDGTGTFEDETAARITWPGDSVAALRVGDLDVDGDVDMLTGGGYDDFFSPPDRLWLNDASGHYAAEPNFPEGFGLTVQFEVADVNGDAWPDVLVANGAEGHLPMPGGNSALLFGLGGAQFQESTAFSSAPWNDATTQTTAIRAGDVDDDGDLDLFVGKSDTTGADGLIGEENLLLYNDGLGGFVDVSATYLVPALSDNTQDARFVDLDGDLDLDIVVANSVMTVQPDESGDVYINQGGLQGGTTGVFHDDPASFLEAWTFGDGIRLTVVAEDLDNDGDADVVVTVHDLFAGADQMLFLNQGGAQGGNEGLMLRQLWFDQPGSGSSGVGDFICWGAAAFDADHDGDREVMLCGNGVVTADPTDQFITRYLRNAKL
jgi:hypothetical protein